MPDFKRIFVEEGLTGCVIARPGPENYSENY